MRIKKTSLISCLTAVVIIAGFVFDCMPALAVNTEENRSSSVQGEICYLVKNGDSLCSIAETVYGDDSYWWKLYQANKKIIGDNPDYIQAGIYLELPDMTGDKLKAESVSERDVDRQLFYRQGDNVYYLPDMDEPDNAIAIWSPHGLEDPVVMGFSDNGKYIIEVSNNGYYRLETAELERNPDDTGTVKTLIDDFYTSLSYYDIEEGETLIYENKKNELVYYDGVEYKVISGQTKKIFQFRQGERVFYYLKYGTVEGTYDWHCYDIDTGKDDCIAAGIDGKSVRQFWYGDGIFIYYKRNADSDTNLDLYMTRLGEEEQKIDEDVYYFYGPNDDDQIIYYVKGMEEEGLDLYCWEEGKESVLIAEKLPESYSHVNIKNGIVVYTKQKDGIFYRIGDTERKLGLPSDRHWPSIEISPDGTKAMVFSFDKDDREFTDSFRIEGDRMIHEAKISGGSDLLVYGCWIGNAYYYAKRVDTAYLKRVYPYDPDRGPTDFYCYKDGIRLTIFSNLQIDFSEDCRVYEGGYVVVLKENEEDYYAGGDLMLYGIGIENNLIDTGVYRYYYVNKNRIVYAKGGNLYVYTNGETHLIAEDMDGFGVHSKRDVW